MQPSGCVGREKSILNEVPSTLSAKELDVSFPFTHPFPDPAQLGAAS